MNQFLVKHFNKPYKIDRNRNEGKVPNFVREGLIKLRSQIGIFSGDTDNSGDTFIELLS